VALGVVITPFLLRGSKVLNDESEQAGLSAEERRELEAHIV
jgi:hypothetical protein